MKYYKNFFHELEKLEKEIEKIKNDLIIVEGKKDKTSLISIGVPQKNIFIINEDGKSLYEKIDEAREIARTNKKDCIILTDFDKKGKQLYMTIKRELSRSNIKLNNHIREILLKLQISHIEGIATVFRKFKKSNFLYSQY